MLVEGRIAPNRCNSRFSRVTELASALGLACPDQNSGCDQQIEATITSLIFGYVRGRLSQPDGDNRLRKTSGLALSSQQLAKSLVAIRINGLLHEQLSQAPAQKAASLQSLADDRIVAGSTR
jgi:hypothetical protein